MKYLEGIKPSFLFLYAGDGLNQNINAMRRNIEERRIYVSRIVNINGKYYDFGTKNGSFLLTASELKKLGIKNYYFMLEVKYPNTGVQDIDPYDPNITAEQIGAVIMECKANPWYFFREVSRVVARGLGELPLYLHRAGCAAIWCFVNSIDFHLVQPRQTYKTTVITAIMSYMVLFEYQNVDIPYMHKTEKRCTDNVGILRDYITALPKYLNPWAKAKHLPGLQSLKYEEHGVSIATVSAAKSENVASDKMRGFSLYAWFVDEMEFIPYMSAVLDGANPTIVQARENAKLANPPIRTCMMSASTPGDLETEEGRSAQSIIDNLPRFNEHMYDLTEDERNNLFVKDNGNGKVEAEPITMVYIEFDYIQLRKDAAYLRAQHRKALQTNTIGEYRRGVLLQRFRGTDGALFDQSDIDYIQSHIRKPDYTLFILKKYNLYVYKHDVETIDITSETPYFDINLPYLIGIDVAAGGNGDNTAIVVLNPYTLEICAEMRSPYIGLFDLMRIITTLGKLIPKAIFCPETNSIGKVIVEFGQETHLEHRIYHDPRLDISKNAMIVDNDPQAQMKRKAIEKGYYGTYVTATVRNNMFDLLKRYIKDYKELINTEFLVNDICNLVKDKKGKIAAANGCHDDVVMAYNHAIYILNYGYNLARFGIDKRKCKFEKVLDVMKEYDHSEEAEVINNTLPYDQPTMYEEQVLHDLTQSTGSNFELDEFGRDRYGYKPSDYDTRGGTSERVSQYDEFTASDYAIFSSMQNF